MSKKIGTSFKYVLAIIILILPYVITYSFLGTRFEAYAHTAALIPFNIVFPLWFLYFFITIKIDSKQKKIEVPAKIFGLIASLIFIYYLLIPFTKELIYLSAGGCQFEVAEGRIEDVNSNAKSFIFKSQHILLEGHDKSYSYMYGHSWVHPGDRIKIKILPKSETVVSLEILERAEK